ncbi:ArsR family transcriptional regulator [Raoultella ornithinolytica]|nr:ArsR family transcriptional regulator [Raoultella ornithinolytica]
MLTFSAAGIDIALPARNSDGTQDLQFAISNIDGGVSTAIRDALGNLDTGTLTYRQYISTDLSAPASVPYTLAIKSAPGRHYKHKITAGYMNVLDTAWPRFRYTLNEFPGLRYMN